MTFENQKPLSTELKELFTDEDKNSDMMYQECMYDPAFPVYDYTKGHKVGERVQIGTREASSGYGKELTQMGVTFDNVDSYGGEDQGRDYWSVWEFTRNNKVVRFKFEGWYASYDGATFEDVFEVSPKKKTITVWQ